jgi:hypothetical protein
MQRLRMNGSVHPYFPTFPACTLLLPLGWQKLRFRSCRLIPLLNLFHVQCVTNGMICYEFTKILLGDQAAEITVTSPRLPNQQDCSAYTGHEILNSYVILAYVWYGTGETVGISLEVGVKRSCFCLVHVVRRLRKSAKSALSCHVCPSVLPFLGRHGTTQFPLDGFSWKFIIEDFSKIYRENSRSLKSDKNNGYFTWRRINIFCRISLVSF